VLGLLFALLTCGCGAEIRWRTEPEFAPVFAESQRDQKLTFVYFRSWYLVQCTEFEDTVLRHAEVVRETRPMNCVKLDFDANSMLARRWGLAEAPAYAVIDPGGQPLSRAYGRITREQLLASLRQAISSRAASQPSAP
jgi:hypothetical protein